MNRQHRFVYAALLLGLLANVSACDDDSDDDTGAPAPVSSGDISASVQEWKVSVGAKSTKAGDLSFTVKNDGKIGHEFLIIKTDIEPGQIPLDGDHFPEDAQGIEFIDEIGEFAIGTTETLNVTLTPGKYQLVCNLPNHYANGMFAAFEVVE